MLKHLFLLNGLLLSVLLFGQVPVNTSASPAMLAVYTQLVQQDTDLYNGQEYHDYAMKVYEDAHPFYSTKNFIKGDVVYNGKLFRNIPLSYDIVLDELIVPHFNRAEAVQFVKNKVTEFWLSGHHFVHIKDSAGLKPGYYDILYKGRNNVIVKYAKTFQSSQLVNGSFQKIITQVKDKYYLYLNGSYQWVSSEKALLQLFSGEDQKLLKRFLYDNNLNISEHPAKTLISIATYLDQHH